MEREVSKPGTVRKTPTKGSAKKAAITKGKGEEPPKHSDSISPKSFYLLVIFACLCLSVCNIVSAYFDYRLNVAEMESRLATEKAYAEYLINISSTLQNVVEN